ncbi:uncharacterized protein LOC141860765 [Acropora palmata]|uniref:uncharacterized protein LOC141860765 n=1 Tax=Acropora palmata TaxID=6131 RepID=UPI003DA0C697
MITKSELNAINRTEAINTLATPVVTYSFNIVDWKMEEIRKLDRKTRKLLTMERMHHPRADVDRMYLPRNKGGRGLIQLEIAYKTATIGLDAYLNATKNDPLLVIAKEHEKAKKKYSVASQATVFRRELNLPEVLEAENEVPTVYARNVKQKAKHQAQVQLKQKWEDKSMHGQYPKRVNEKDVDHQLTNQWLKSGGLKSETEGFIIAAQDQAIKTNYYRRNILNDGTDPMCGYACGQYQETIDHIVAGCPELAKTEYLHRHDKAASYLHWNICKELNINVEEKWYEHEPQTVTERDNITILWDMLIQTDPQS